jgi:hypothetical protein
MEGLLDRFMSVFNQLSRINQIALTMHNKACEFGTQQKQSGNL